MRPRARADRCGPARENSPPTEPPPFGGTQATKNQDLCASNRRACPKREAETLSVSLPRRVLSITYPPAFVFYKKAAPACGAVPTRQASSQDLDLCRTYHGFGLERLTL